MIPRQLYFSAPKNRAAFSVIEIAVAVAIIGILAALAIPAYVRSKDSAKIATLVNDLRVYKQVFQTYELEKESFPDSQPNPGQYPIGMSDSLPHSWTEPSPIGGTYRWIYTAETNPEDRSAYIRIVNDASNPILLPAERLDDIDEALDDGNVNTGSFQKYGLNLEFYIKNQP